MVGFDSLIDEIVLWQRRTFPRGSVHSVAAHLSREVDELRENPLDPEEIADVFILTIGLANRAGVDLRAAVAAKHAKNLSRKWGEPDAEGVIEHVPEGGESRRLRIDADGVSDDEIRVLRTVERFFRRARTANAVLREECARLRERAEDDAEFMSELVSDARDEYGAPFMRCSPGLPGYVRALEDGIAKERETAEKLREACRRMAGVSDLADVEESIRGLETVKAANGGDGDLEVALSLLIALRETWPEDAEGMRGAS